MCGLVYLSLVDVLVLLLNYLNRELHTLATKKFKYKKIILVLYVHRVIGYMAGYTF